MNFQTNKNITDKNSLEDCVLLVLWCVCVFEADKVSVLHTAPHCVRLFFLSGSCAQFASSFFFLFYFFFSIKNPRFLTLSAHGATHRMDSRF